jgi:predicted transcriptional regulator
LGDFSLAPGIYWDIINRQKTERILFYKMEINAMNEKIGQTAGQIWQILAKSPEPVTLTTLAKKADTNSQMTQMALGWLAREGKLKFEEKGKTLYVSLCTAGVCS